MKNLWLKIGCFLTGHNYNIVRNSSEASAKAVKKYLSALLIVGTLWFLIGYAFTQRYLHGSMYMSLFGAFMMLVLVIQIERQIILSVGKKNNLAYSFRILIGIVMAVLGSVILDQIIFKDDVDKAQISNIQSEVDRLLPIRTRTLSGQIQDFENAIQQKENERAKVINEISSHPTIYIPSSSNEFVKDPLTGKMVLQNKIVTSNSIPNPKAEMIPSIDTQIKDLRQLKTIKENDRLHIQDELKKELESKTGFLDELKILFTILFSSPIALGVWFLLFLFFVAIELFVLVNKTGDSDNDYDKIIVHQMETRIKMLEKLTEKSYGKGQYV